MSLLGACLLAAAPIFASPPPREIKVEVLALRPGTPVPWLKANTLPALPGAANAVLPTLAGPAALPSAGLDLPVSAAAPQGQARAPVAALEGALKSAEASQAGPQAAAPSLGRLFDGGIWAPLASGGGHPQQAQGPFLYRAEGLPAYLAATSAADARELTRIVRQALRSKTARGILEGVERLASARGRPVIVVFSRIKNSGEFNYDWDIVSLQASHRKGNSKDGAMTLVHELLHVLQRAQELPSDAFEMEFEAYLTEFKMDSELGFKPARGTFDEQARRQFKKGVDKFVRWLKTHYKDNIALIGSSVEEYLAKVEERADKAQRAAARLEARLAEKRAVLKKMEETGAPEEFRAAYRADEVEPLEKRLRASEVLLRWYSRDRALLSDPEGRKRYEEFAQRVLREARAFRRRLISS